MELVRDPDLEGLCKNVREWIKGHPNQEKMKTDPQHTFNILTNLRQAGCLISLALREGDRYVGCLLASIGPTIHSPELEAAEHVLYIEEEYRSYRTVSKMIDAFIKEARAMGATNILLADTSGHDERVATLYKRKNFHRIGSYYELKEK